MCSTGTTVSVSRTLVLLLNYSNGKEKVCCVLFFFSVAEDGWLVHLLPEKLVYKDSGSISRFDTDLFESLEKVQPIAIKANRIFPIRLLDHPINWVRELLWQLFTPFTSYSVTYLRPMARLANESTPDFAERVCQAIVHQLNVPASFASSGDSVKAGEELKHLGSRVGSEDSSLSSSSSAYPTTSRDTTTRSSWASEELDPDSALIRQRGSHPLRGSIDGADKGQERREQNGLASVCPVIDTSFDHLIPTISKILSHLPREEVRAALVQSSGDVDAAIDFLVSSDQANEQDCASSTSSLAKELPNTDLVAPSRLKTAAEAFHSNSSARQASLTERRQALLKYARSRFLVSTNRTGASVD
ncbi:hypothetical protein FGIG_08988 [Fasciola gigantica]|uniref:CUE domain-containing protein n=1 Tax=Fasciola gigantica TaxID=46835 RepID=A0A504YL17_FASGI|nr:hypothetical protein FGIG_08988 [Fasciola gigantica]